MLTCQASTEAAVAWFLREPASPQICSAAGKFHQGKQEGNGKADAESLNEILNCEILTLKTPSTQAKEAEKQSMPTFQQLAFPWCAELTDLLAPWHRNEKCPPPGGSHSLLSWLWQRRWDAVRPHHRSIRNRNKIYVFLPRENCAVSLGDPRFFAIEKNKRSFHKIADILEKVNPRHACHPSSTRSP